MAHLSALCSLSVGVNRVFSTTLFTAVNILTAYLFRETSFGERIADIRRDELKTLMKSAYLKAVSTSFWSITPLLVSIVTFSVYTLLGNEVLPPSLSFYAIPFLLC